MNNTKLILVSIIAILLLGLAYFSLGKGQNTPDITSPSTTTISATTTSTTVPSATFSPIIINYTNIGNGQRIPIQKVLNTPNFRINITSDKTYNTNYEALVSFEYTESNGTKIPTTDASFDNNGIYNKCGSDYFNKSTIVTINDILIQSNSNISGTVTITPLPVDKCT